MLERSESRDTMSSEAFRSLVRREGDRWLRLAVRLAGAAEGPDVLQEALVKAWLGFSDGSAPAADPVESSRWVVRVVVNQAYDAVRARGRRQRWAGLFRWAFPDHARVETLEASVEVAELERFVNALTPEQRIAWVLKEVEGYSGAEVASLTGVSEGAVEQRLLRARAALQRGLGHES
jgi:RNA polymerase sigma-70 factor (ECF subfamily)